jgi:hypothetical protein
LRGFGVATRAVADGHCSQQRSQRRRRRHVLRWYPLIDSWLGRLSLRFFILLQDLYLDRDWGTGYIVRAAKP